MTTGKQLKQLAQMRVIEMVSGQSKDLNTGCRFGYESALRDAGARDMAIFDVLDAAEDWAKLNCPAVMWGKTCQAGCNNCMSIPLSAGIVKRINQ